MKAVSCIGFDCLLPQSLVKEGQIMTNEYTYIDQLVEDCKQAKLARHNHVIKGSDAASFKGVKNAVYVIEEIGGDTEQTFKKFEDYKLEKERACPKPNQANQIMYVGSSVGNLETRIKQHIGKNKNKSTSALNLCWWFFGKIQITAKVYDVSPSVLQIIEDSLHYHLKPAFGKKGGNGK